MTSVGYVGFGQVGRERERENTREKIFFFTCLCAFRGRRRPTLPLKMTLFWHFFYEQYMKQCWFEQNALFLLKENGAKKVNFQISHQFVIYSIKSSIVIFILRINSIAFFLNSNVSPDVGCLFHFGP
jgi:hypothetical protein